MEVSTQTASGNVEVEHFHFFECCILLKRWKQNQEGFSIHDSNERFSFKGEYSRGYV